MRNAEAAASLCIRLGRVVSAPLAWWPPPLDGQAGRATRGLDRPNECLPAYHFATNSVGMVQQARRALLIQAKHQGLATNVPVPIQYEEPHARLKEEFDDKQPPALLVTFDAAVW